ncbi:MAG TPA: TIGR02266 family protein [Polyangiaceae bacterium LLY-WYZ-15_(1-7)]|nr:TIGR02266 family protein [Polyangiaceae bacterium LLY-WYZ-15_(1-7)]
MADTRRDKRAPLSLKVRFKSATLDEFVEHYSKDISRGGIFIKSKKPMKVGTLLKFEFQLKDESALIHGVGRVVWQRTPDESSAAAPAGMGIKFIKMDADSRAFVQDIVEKRGNAPGTFDAGKEGPKEGFFPDEGPAKLPDPEDRTSVRHASEFLAEALSGAGASAADEAKESAEEARKRTEAIQKEREEKERARKEAEARAAREAREREERAKAASKVAREERERGGEGTTSDEVTTIAKRPEELAKQLAGMDAASTQRDEDAEATAAAAEAKLAAGEKDADEKDAADATVDEAAATEAEAKADAKTADEKTAGAKDDAGKTKKDEKAAAKKADADETKKDEKAAAAPRPPKEEPLRPRPPAAAASERPPPPKEPSSMPLILGILLLGGVAVGGYFLFAKGDEDAGETPEVA